MTDLISFSWAAVTADSDCSHEIKGCLLLGREAMITLDIILKSRDINFLTEVYIVKVMIFPVVMYKCESWSIKKNERKRIDVFGEVLSNWRRLLRVPWTARRWNLSILKEISPEYSLEGLLLKLKLQYFSLADSLEKNLMLGKIKDKKRWRGEGEMDR